MFGKILKNLRLERNETQEDVGKAVGVTTSMVGMYETNARKPSYDVLSKIAEYFGCSIDYVVGKSPFKTASETKYSIIVAAMKELLNDEKHEKLIWNTAVEIAELLYTDDTAAFVKELRCDILSALKYRASCEVLSTSLYQTLIITSEYKFDTQATLDRSRPCHWGSVPLI